MTLANVMSALRRSPAVPGHRDDVAAAVAAIKSHLAECDRLRPQIDEARGRETRVRAELERLDVARRAEAAARAAELADRQRRATEGNPGVDPALTAAVEQARRAVEDVEAAAAAAEAALPALESRRTELERALEQETGRIDEAVWKLRMAQLAAELPEVRAAAEIVRDFARRLAAVTQVGLRHKLDGSPGGPVPKELTDVVALTPPRMDELEPLIRREREYLRRLRESPDAQLDPKE